MNIAFIGQKGIPATFGGVEYHVDSLSREIVKNKLSVSVYVRSWYTPKGMKEIDGVKLIHVPTIKSKHLDASIHSLLCSIHAVFTSVDIVHYHCMGPALFSFIPKLFGKKVIVTVHRLDWISEKWNKIAKFFLKLGERISIRIPQKTIVVSKDLKKFFMNGYKSSNLHHITHGIEAVQPIKANLISKKYGLVEKNYLLYLGRISPEKRVEWIIKAFFKMGNQSKTTKRIKLVIAGGSSATGKYVESLKRLSSNNQDIIFPGYVTGREKDELLSNAKIFLLPSSLEGFPIALMEGKNYGNCCLVSNIPPHQESITDDVDGLLFKTESFRDFEEKLNYLVNNPKKIKLIGKNAREKMKLMPSWETVAKETIEIYKNVISGKS